MEKTLVIYNLLWVGVWSYVGVLARVGLASAVANSPTKHSFLLNTNDLGAGYFLPNILGSFVMGIFSGLQGPKNPFSHLFLGITTGFCGSCTTFATWQYSVAKEFLNEDVETAFLHLLTTFTASFLALRFGKHFGETIKPFYFPHTHSSVEDHTSNNSITFVIFRVQILPLAVVFLTLTIIVWVLAFVPSLENETRGWFIAMVFGPVGAGTRYLLSLHNPSFPRFPLFTFIPNITGTVVNVFIGMALSALDLGTDQKLWLGKGFSTGCMGSLSTVSTWVNELDRLSESLQGWAYLYGLGSVIIAQALATLIGGLWIATGHEL